MFPHRQNAKFAGPTVGPGLIEPSTRAPGSAAGTLRVAVAQTTSNTTDTLEQNAAKLADWVGRAAAEVSAKCPHPPRTRAACYTGQDKFLLSKEERGGKVGEADCGVHPAGHRVRLLARPRQGARVILFPELAITGYFPASVAALAGPTGSKAVANARLRAAEGVVAAACKRGNIYALIGTPVFFADVNASSPACTGLAGGGAGAGAPCPRPWYNTALLIAPNGTKVRVFGAAGPKSHAA